MVNFEILNIQIHPSRRHLPDKIVYIFITAMLIVIVRVNIINAKLSRIIEYKLPDITILFNKTHQFC